MSNEPKTSIDDRIDLADTAIGGQFTLKVKANRVCMSCDDCEWTESTGEMPLWEWVCDAREHWEREHAR
ncbi:MAG TPA: hypothetical protein VHE33_10045 [Acidobacteriaceae bacterium]|nr:hypothetical protein [Acidobacteriaceae bacterium]